SRQPPGRSGPTTPTGGPCAPNPAGGSLALPSLEGEGGLHTGGPLRTLLRLVLRRGLACPQRHVVAHRVPLIDLTRPTDLVDRVVDHLDVLSNPARQAPERKQRGEHLRRKAHRRIDKARIEVDIRIQLAFDEV